MRNKYLGVHQAPYQNPLISVAISDDDMGDVGIENVDLVGVESNESSGNKGGQVWNKRVTYPQGRQRYR